MKLLKIAAKVVRSARYITFKLCSSCPYKDEFYETPENIIPSPLNKSVAEAVAKAVTETAIKEDVARI